MALSRREFMQMAAAGSAASLAVPRSLTARPAPRASRILVLGGTGFIGPHIVRRALARSHDVTIFNRGRTNTDLFPNVEKLVGDRNGDLDSLRGRTWDIVIDNSASDPRWVRLTAQLLKDSVGRYFFTSTRSVTRRWPTVGITALTSELLEADPGAIDRGESLGYGRNKVLCERETRLAFGDRALIVRPGLIVGPGDDTDRFTYWPVRIDRGGEVLAPGDPDYPAMFIDVRDLADWYIHLVEQGTTGIYMALGPASRLSFAELLYGCRAVTATPVSFTWVDTDFLLDRKMRPYADFPVWMPPRGDRVGFQQYDLTREWAAGLTYRPLAVTAYDTLEFHKSRPAERQANLKSGLKAERERELLQEWHAMNPR